MLKEKIKKNKLIMNLYTKMCKLERILLCKISPELISKIMYEQTQNKKLDLKNPKLFNEKLMYLKLNDYYKNDLIIKCSDKYRVREYICEKKCEEILNELYGVYDKPKEIDWDNLPEKFVLKCTHGCGFNIICDNKQKLDKKDAIKKLTRWEKEKFGYETGEIHYTYIKPKIICEEYLETEDGLLPNDYKIYCFNGKPELVLVCTERNTKLRLNFLDLNWNEIDIGTENFKSDKSPKKPDNFDDMVEYARRLSQPFKFVRVDFYNCNGKVIFGELTFTPAGCCAQYYNDKGSRLLGDMLKI